MTERMRGQDAMLAGLVRPEAGECHVWQLPIDGWDGQLELLDERERARHARFHQDADRRRYQAAHIGVRLLLGGYLGVEPQRLRFGHRCRHCGADHGKPYVADPPTTLDFSLTHSGDQVAVAVAVEPVGIDVEQLDRGNDIDSVARVALSPDELAWLSEQPNDIVRRAFFGYWVRKEALLKATGHGLAVPLSEITLTPPFEPAGLLRWAADQPLESPVQLFDLDVGPGYAGSVALLTNHSIRITQNAFPVESPEMPTGLIRAADRQ